MRLTWQPLAVSMAAMGVDQHMDWRAAAASALEWWQDAGIDALVGEEPRDWLARPAPLPAPAAPPGAAAPARAVQALVAEAEALPDTIAAFTAWRLSDHAPDAGWAPVRCFAEGPADAELCVLTDMPGDDGLIGGDAGRLFDRMLGAIGRRREAVHIVGLCAAPPLAGRMPAGLSEALGHAARHYLGMIRPQRLLLLGKEPAEAVLGPDATQQRGRLQQVNHGDATSRAVASFHPRFLLDTPMAKAAAWRDLQLLIGGTA